MKAYWLWFTGVIVISFSVLGWVGTQIYNLAPPIPSKVVTANGNKIFSKADIEKGQNVWQEMGGMEVGSVWGHGSYVAPDWTADWLHRELIFVLNKWAELKFNNNYYNLTDEQKASLRAKLHDVYKRNTFDTASGAIIIDSIRALAIENNIKHYDNIFTKGKDAYAIRPNTITDSTKLRELSAFFFWTSWAAATNRPNEDITYTSNWPHEELIDNKPTSDSIVWTGVSILFLLAGIGGMAWYYASQGKQHTVGDFPMNDPLLGSSLTPSQRSVIKYFWVVTGLMLLQIIMGVITAHYGVEGNGFYGFQLSRILPYPVTRTWHLQLGIFWIATAWLASGLYIGPAVSGVEPK
jgi:nitric oxide reductase subunit B